MIKIICNRCNKAIESIQKVGFIQFCYQNPFENSMADENILDRNHYCDDCMAEIEQFVQNKTTEIVIDLQTDSKMLSDTITELHKEVNKRKETGIPPITEPLFREKDFISKPHKQPALIRNVRKETKEVEHKEPETQEKPKKAVWIDTGKILALWKAKWSVKAIADEMGMEESEVSKILAR